MAMSSNSVVGIVLVVVLAALIGSIFIGDVLGQVEDEGSNQVVISSQEEMMKLILYDSMIAYGCDVGGELDIDGDKFWGDWNAMQTYASDIPGNPRIYFGDLNSSMPTKFQGLPCYGTGSTLPGTGTKLSNTKLASKQWRDDQEGKYSKIEFKINDSDSSTDIEIPKCFVHFTHDNGITSGSLGWQYEARDPDEVTNSWFFMSKQDQPSIHDRGEAIGLSDNTIQCTTITDTAVKKSPSDNNAGPAMNVEVLDDNVGEDLSNGGTDNIESSNFWPSNPIQINKFNFPKGTTGYIQTNVGCTSINSPHSISDTPGVADKEIKGDGGTCDNKLHPFIVITSVP